MDEVSAEELQQAVERMHSCKAVLVASEALSETLEGKTVWEGVVHHFVLDGHPTANVAYAWSSPIEGSTQHRTFAVLHVAPIQSAQDAVRATIAQEHRTGAC